jgi:uncharacterized protein YbaR (Trm112 family)
MDCPACKENVPLAYLAEALYGEEDQVSCPECGAVLAITLEIMN